MESTKGFTDHEIRLLQKELIKEKLLRQKENLKN